MFTRFTQFLRELITHFFRVLVAPLFPPLGSALHPCRQGAFSPLVINSCEVLKLFSAKQVEKIFRDCMEKQALHTLEAMADGEPPGFLDQVGRDTRRERAG